MAEPVHKNENDALEAVKNLHRGYSGVASKLLIAHVVSDTIEILEGAKFSGKIEGDKSITITRATEDGEKKWDETIFPNADGTYTIGNVRFPNITDAIKAANMRNWVRWHESEGHELHTEESSIQVNDGVFNDTDLIKN